MKITLLAAALLCASVACAAEPPAPWYVTLHGSDVGHDLTRSQRALEAARDLGVGGVRFDVHWHEIQPTPGEWNRDVLTFYTCLVSQARSFDLDPLVVLSGEPGWARSLYASDAAAFWRAYEAYVAQVVAWVGDRVERYQLWNEANHPLWRFVRPRDAWQLFARAGRRVKRMDPGATTLINVLADVPGWERALTRWLSRGGEHVDVVGIDHYPRTWSWRSPTDWAPLKTLLRRVATPGDALHGKRVAVLETGCSAWPQRVVGEEGQRRWIERAIPALHEIVRAANAKTPGRVVLLGYYQLIDARDQPMQEGAFGLHRLDLSRKPAADALRAQLRPRRRPAASGTGARRRSPGTARPRGVPTEGSSPSPSPPRRSR